MRTQGRSTQPNPELGARGWVGRKGFQEEGSSELSCGASEGVRLGQEGWPGSECVDCQGAALSVELKSESSSWARATAIVHCPLPPWSRLGAFRSLADSSVGSGQASGLVGLASPPLVWGGPSPQPTLCLQC